MRNEKGTKCLRRSVWMRLLCLLMVLTLTGCDFFGGENKSYYKEYTPKPEESAEASEEPEVKISRAEAMELAGEYLKTMTPEEKIGQLFVVNLELLDTRKGGFYEFRKCTKKMKEALEKYHVGGVILFSRNIGKPNKTKKMIADLQEASEIPLFVTVDEEGGEVARIGSNKKMGTTSFPSAEEIGKEEDGNYVYEMGRTIGREIKSLGFNVDFAPVADVRTSDLNTEIGSRSFGDDPEKVADLVSAFVQGIQEKNVSATLKHFPGQGSSNGDTHVGSVNIDSSIARLRKVDFVPFQSGIEAGADFVMVSHISVSRVTETTVPASMSELVMQTILREELGFKGVVITDALDMSSITDYYTPAETAYNTFKAGADIILMPTDLDAAYQEIWNKVKDGTIEESRLNESVLRILTVKFQRGILKEMRPVLTPTPETVPTMTAAPAADSTKKKQKSGKTAKSERRGNKKTKEK